MQVKTILAAASALNGTIQGSGRCGFPPPSLRHLTAARQLAAQEAVAPANAVFSAPNIVNITVHWHTIAANTTEAGGYSNETTVERQMDVMNEIYNQYGFAFNLASADWVLNKTWAEVETYDQLVEMKTALRKGSYADLNMYTMLLPGLLGMAAAPEANVTAGSALFNWDGIIMAVGSMPGGNIEYYNLGYTAVHEIGHWLGLFHTFQGGCEDCTGSEECSADGDLVDDTPAEAIASSKCPIGRDTCTSPGEDPIHNYMDYSYDSCFTEFTPGQAIRMRSTWDKFRAGY